MTITGVVVSTFIGATGLGVILPAPDNDIEKTVFVEVEQIKSNRYTDADHARYAEWQAGVDADQDLAIQRLEAKLDELIEEMTHDR